MSEWSSRRLPHDPARPPPAAPSHRRRRCRRRHRRRRRPVVVQSMTNTDTADVEGTVAPGGGAGPRRLGAGAHHRRPRRGGRRRAAYPRAARPHGRRRAAHRRLPLYRPHAAHRPSGLRRGAGQIPHQSRQCRLRREARPPVRDPDRARHPPRQAGPDRRQLGLARPVAADPPDGRQRRQRLADVGPRGDARGDRPVRRSSAPPAPRRSAFRATASSSRPRSARCRISSPSMPSSRAAPTMPSTSG